MSQTQSKRTDTRDRRTQGGADDGRSTNLRDSPMMAYLMDALEEGTDIGHYGRLTFAMIARHFLDEDELVRQVEGRDYNPPKRERILEWQAQQEFPICPTPDDPATCNVYRELRFPDSVYEQIEEFWEEKAQQ